MAYCLYNVLSLSSTKSAEIYCEFFSAYSSHKYNIFCNVIHVTWHWRNTFYLFYQTFIFYHSIHDKHFPMGLPLSSCSLGQASAIQKKETGENLTFSDLRKFRSSNWMSKDREVAWKRKSGAEKETVVARKRELREETFSPAGDTGKLPLTRFSLRVVNNIRCIKNHQIEK